MSLNAARRAICAMLFLVGCVAITMPLLRVSADAKSKMITGIVYRIHPGFLEVQNDPKNIAVVKVNAATIYWNGKTDKKASAKDLAAGQEVVIEATEKDGLATAQKVRFLPNTN
jgi:hypothetical protein